MQTSEESFAGIGSRNLIYKGVNLRPGIIEKIRGLYINTNIKYYTLNSGAADGMDAVFENIHDSFLGKKNIFLPWKGFNGSKSLLYNSTPEAVQLAYQYHPLGNKLSGPALALMARNGHQVLGKDLLTPVKFVLYWTVDSTKGGTSQALRIAKAYEIPTFNVLDPNIINKVKDIIG
jgi:hypothetical protein